MKLILKLIFIFIFYIINIKFIFIDSKLFKKKNKTSILYIDYFIKYYLTNQVIQPRDL